MARRALVGGGALTGAALAAAALTGGVAARREAAAVAAHPAVGAFVEVDGARVHHVRRGSGPELVLIHGAGGNLRDFTFSFLERAARRYTVTAFDRPGLGYSDRVPGTPTGPAATRAETLAEQAAHLRAAAVALGVRRPIVLGHSYGGAVALAWALGDLADPGPAAAAALVPLAAVAMPWPGGLGPVYRTGGSALGGAVVVPMMTAFVPERRIETAIAGSFAPQTAPEGYAAHLGGRLTLRRDTFRANARQVNTLRPQIVAQSRRHAALALPVEVVHGERDGIVPAEVHAEPLARRAPGAHLTILRGVGHMPHHVDPDAVLAAVDRAAARAGLA